jgi:hypothetical protein
MEYTIRKEMILCDLEQWKIIDSIFKGDTCTMTVDFCLENIGLISAKTAICNDEEREFIEELYKDARC